MIGDPSERERRPLMLALGGGVVVAGALVALVFTLGSWAYQHRRYTLHDGRLKRLVEQHPTVADASQGILAEPGNRAIPAPPSEPALRAWVARWPTRADEVLRKWERWPMLRIFNVGDLVYVLYFDDGGLLRDYVLLGP
jgi:hypothetical protein